MEGENGGILTIQIYVTDDTVSSMEKERDWWNLRLSRQDAKHATFDHLLSSMAPTTTKLALNFPVGSADTPAAIAVIGAISKIFYSAAISVCGLFTRVFSKKAAWKMIASLPPNVRCIEIKMAKMPEDGVPAATWMAAPNLQDVHVMCEWPKTTAYRCFSRSKW